MPIAELKRRFELFRSCRAAVVTDDASPTGRGVLVSPAQSMTAQEMNRLLTIARGLPLVALFPDRVNEFLLDPMTRPQTAAAHEPNSAAQYKICVSVEAREGVSTGISAADRAITVSILGEPMPSPRKLIKPGHIFPVEARAGGVLIKAALPEAAIDLVHICGFTDAALFFDLLSDDGNYLSATEQQNVALAERLPSFALSELIEYRLQTEQIVERVVEAKLPTTLAGELRSIVYRSKIHSGEHLALVKGEIDPEQAVLTRVQPEFTFSDVFGGTKPQSRLQLQKSLEAIGKRGSGVLVYLRRTDFGQLQEQISAPENAPRPAAAALMREYGLGAQILRDLGVKKIELLTGSVRGLAGLASFGIEITAQHPIPGL